MVEQPCLLYGLVNRRTGEVLDNVARVAARGLSNDVAGCDLAILDGAVQFGTAIPFCKGPDEGMLARAFGQTAEWNGRCAGDAGTFQPLPNLADESARRPGAFVNAKNDGLRSAPLGQVGGEIGHAGTFGQDHEQFGCFEILRQKFIRVVDNDGQGCRALPHGDLPAQRCTGAQMIGDAPAPLSLYGDEDAHAP